MSICVITDDNGNLITSNLVPCPGTILVGLEDDTSGFHLDYVTVSLLFTAAAGCYALVSVFNLALFTMGFRNKG